MIIHKAKMALLVSALVVALGVILLKEQIQQLNPVSLEVKDDSRISPAQNNHPEYACNESLEQDENDLAFAHLEDVEFVDCVVVGCGGLF